MKDLENKHPLAIRWFHWINFPVLMIMIWSGLLIYWANDVYRLGWGDTTRCGDLLRKSTTSSASIFVWPRDVVSLFLHVVLRD
jgi:hypothetical protein